MLFKTPRCWALPQRFCQEIVLSPITMSEFGQTARRRSLSFSIDGTAFPRSYRACVLLEHIIRLRHMLDSANEAVGFASGKKREDLDKNRMLTLSIIKSIEIIVVLLFFVVIFSFMSQPAVSMNAPLPAPSQ